MPLSPMFDPKDNHCLSTKLEEEKSPAAAKYSLNLFITPLFSSDTARNTLTYHSRTSKEKCQKCSAIIVKMSRLRLKTNRRLPVLKPAVPLTVFEMRAAMVMHRLLRHQN